MNQPLVSRFSSRLADRSMIERMSSKNSTQTIRPQPQVARASVMPSIVMMLIQRPHFGQTTPEDFLNGLSSISRSIARRRVA